jgi:hypothetical protein
MGVDKPYYLEPGYESEVGGGQLSEQRSAEYNDNLRFNTIRCAVAVCI